MIGPFSGGLVGLLGRSHPVTFSFSSLVVVALVILFGVVTLERILSMIEGGGCG